MLCCPFRQDVAMCDPKKSVLPSPEKGLEGILPCTGYFQLPFMVKHFVVTFLVPVPAVEKEHYYEGI